jgi:hypothetical protein
MAVMCRRTLRGSANAAGSYDDEQGRLIACLPYLATPFGSDTHDDIDRLLLRIQDIDSGGSVGIFDPAPSLSDMPTLCIVQSNGKN